VTITELQQHLKQVLGLPAAPRIDWKEPDYITYFIEQPITITFAVLMSIAETIGTTDFELTIDHEGGSMLSEETWESGNPLTGIKIALNKL
jgi:hypothetical protein